MKDLKVVSFGEILWDVFPDRKALGGAPLNIAARLASLGAETRIISKLGDDPLANETLKLVSELNLDLELIQTDETLETGQVTVTLDETGSASYVINQPVAWDAIELTDQNKAAVKEADIFLFGSLVARNETSRATLNALLSTSDFAVFDVNLRAPHYTLEQVYNFMKQAQFVKMNDEELDEIIAHLQIKEQNMEDQLKALNELINCEAICVTCGAEGAVLFKDDTLFSHSGFSTKVVDTVGAGDSFLAGLIYQLYQEENSPDEALEFACALGALVAGTKGANAKVTFKDIAHKINE